MVYPLLLACLLFGRHTLKYRRQLGEQAADHATQHLAKYTKFKQTSWAALMVKHIFKGSVVQDKRRYVRLKEVVKKACTKWTHQLGRKYTASFLVSTCQHSARLLPWVSQIVVNNLFLLLWMGVLLHEWSKQQPAKARKTRPAVYCQIYFLNKLMKEQVSKKEPRLVDLDLRRRR